MAYQRKDQIGEHEQYYIPAPQPQDGNTGYDSGGKNSAISEAGAGLTLATGDFLSPNYARGSRGWKINSEGNAEFQSIKVQRGFGGSGADGALVIPAGTTNIDLASAQVVIKNYTSISITGTGKLTFTNPHANGTNIILKSQGDVVITSSTSPAIDASGLGGAAGVGGAQGGAGNSGQGGAGGNSANTQGGQGAAGNGVGVSNTGTAGSDGQGLFTAGGGPAGTSSAASTVAPSTTFTAYNPSFGINAKSLVYMPGGGGGGAAGGTAAGQGGDGGRGGGALVIECGGALNVTSTLTAAGKNGGSNAQTNGGNGGGGGGGCILILYITLTKNTGTYTVTGGAAGTGGANAGGAGGVGFSIVAQNISFI